MGTRWRLTAAGATPGKVPQKSYRRRRLSGAVQVRVKWCGKSAPRDWRQERHGKPHREQDQIGVAGRAGDKLVAPGTFPGPPPGLVARGGQQWPSQMNGRRGGATLQTEPGLQAGWCFVRAAHTSSRAVSMPFCGHVSRQYVNDDESILARREVKRRVRESDDPLRRAQGRDDRSSTDSLRAVTWNRSAGQVPFSASPSSVPTGGALSSCTATSSVRSLTNGTASSASRPAMNQTLPARIPFGWKPWGLSARVSRSSETD